MNSRSTVEFDILYDRYSSMMYRIALARLSSTYDAQDVVHDVFLTYFEKCPEFDSEEHRKAWFIRSAINRSIDLVRKQSNRQSVLFDEEVNYSHSSGDEESPIFSMIGALPDKYKSVVILHYLEGFSVEETASILKISQSAVKMRLARARERLKSSRKEGLDVQ